MENQHQKIRGYRELSESEIELMNQVKDAGVVLGELVEILEALQFTDKRWVEEGKMDLQKGFMCLTRSIAKPTFF